MKSFIKHLLFCFIFITQAIVVDAGSCIDQISRTIEKGNASGIAAYFDQNVSLSLPGSQANYSQAQAEMILNDFFKKNPVQEINIQRRGDNGHSQFAIGQLTTSKGNYRVYISVKENGKDCIVKEIRLEK